MKKLLFMCVICLFYLSNLLSVTYEVRVGIYRPNAPSIPTVANVAFIAEKENGINLLYAFGTTNSAGFIRFEGLPDVKYYTIKVCKPGYELRVSDPDEPFQKTFPNNGSNPLDSMILLVPHSDNEICECRELKKKNKKKNAVLPNALPCVEGGFGLFPIRLDGSHKSEQKLAFENTENRFFGFDTQELTIHIEGNNGIAFETIVVRNGTEISLNKVLATSPEGYTTPYHYGTKFESLKGDRIFMRVSINRGEATVFTPAGPFGGFLNCFVPADCN